MLSTSDGADPACCQGDSNLFRPSHGTDAEARSGSQFTCPFIPSKLPSAPSQAFCRQ